jgi:hypothetical protein
MSGLLIAQIPPGPGNYVVPTEPPAELAHSAWFETFDGLEPLVNNDQQPIGNDYGAPSSPRPGGGGTPIAAQVFTRGAVPGITGRLGGQPLPVAPWMYRTGRGYTEGIDALGAFQRLHYGVGQNYQGPAQTVQLSEITNAPPIPGDLTGIIAGVA